MPTRKYLLFSSYFGAPSRGGGVTLSLEVVSEWLARGHEVHIFAANYPSGKLGPLESYIASGKLTIHRLVEPAELAFGHKLNDVLFEQVKFLVQKINPDFIHVHNFQAMLSGVDAALKSGCPSVYTALDFGLICITWYLYDGTISPCTGPGKKKCQECCLRTKNLRLRDGPQQILNVIERLTLNRRGKVNSSYFKWSHQNYWREKAVMSQNTMLRVLRNFGATVAPSPPVLREIEKFRGKRNNFQVLYPISAKKISSAEPANDISLKRPLRLTFLGHSDPIKGWEFFLEALKNLPDNLNLEIWDGGGNTAIYENANARVKRYLKKSYRCPIDSLPALFRDSDAILVPSLWYENTPLVVLEALANSRPVVASNQIGISHVVVHGKNGVLIEPGNQTAWINTLVEMSRTPDELRAMRSRCEFNRTPKEFVDDLEGIESCIENI